MFTNEIAIQDSLLESSDSHKRQASRDIESAIQ